MEMATERQEDREAMASKNPKTPAPARAAKSINSKGTTSPAAPRRRATKAAAPAVAPAVVVASESAVADQPLAESIDYAEQVRIRAYFLHLERRGRPGNPVEDWLAAEREIANGADRDAEHAARRSDRATPIAAPASRRHGRPAPPG